MGKGARKMKHLKERLNRESKENMIVEIVELHSTVDMLVEALIWLKTAIVPEAREYDEFNRCSMHKETLELWNRKTKEAIDKAKEIIDV